MFSGVGVGVVISVCVCVGVTVSVEVGVVIVAGVVLGTVAVVGPAQLVINKKRDASPSWLALNIPWKLIYSSDGPSDAL